MRHNRYIAVILLLLILCSCTSSTGGKQPVVQNGVADLTATDFYTQGITELRGNWEFYYSRLLEPGDINSAQAGQVSYIRVPDNWDYFSYNGKPIGSYGCATYRVKIITANDDPLYLQVMPPNSSYKIFTNGKPAGECGKPGKTGSEESPRFKIITYEVVPENRTIDIVVQVSNHFIYLGGMLLPVRIGTREKIYDSQIKRIAFDVSIFASLLIISIYYFGLFLMRKTEKAYLLFSLFTLMLSIRALIINEMFIYQLLPDNWFVFFSKMDFLATTLCVPVFIYFIYQLYPVVTKALVRRSFLAAAMAYSFIIIFFPVRIYSKYLPVFNIITILACIFVVYVLARAVIDRQTGAKLALLGFIILFGTVVNDILAIYGISGNLQLSSFGVFSFILMQSFISSMKFAEAFRSIEELSHNLEIKVSMRTQELEAEKSQLKLRNQTIENELLIARQIQKQIIPSHSPLESIHAFYKPMDKVGGDFYDFLKYRDSEKIGIFLSDVSGHGVPAAFITSMVKTTLLQAGTDRENPAALLESLNDLLLNQTGGHFVTAFYGIYDPATREFLYSNSGHNPPFVMTSGNLTLIDGKKSIPLAIIKYDPSGLSQKARLNNSIVLEKGSKVLFYTDGLTEATPCSGPKVYFEERLINECIPKYAGDSPSDFIDNIYGELVRFRGSESFDDDICMICMDVE